MPTTTHVRERLRAERERLAAEAEGLARDLDLARWDCDVADIIDAGSASAERGTCEAQLLRVRARLDAVEDAFRRVEAGSYGTCTSCGGPITGDRLDALPATPSCVACAGRRTTG